MIPFNNTLKEIVSRAESAIKKLITGDGQKKTELIINIENAKTYFNNLLLLKKEEELLKKQHSTLSKVSSDFNSKQQREMEKILSEISTNLRVFYTFMAGKEQVKDIELETIENKEGVFSGIGLKMKFYEEETHSSKTYLSESRLDCLGLSLFLASVKLFNKKSRFFILDDVISSFDKNHRLRFGQLITEKFGDYQIFVFTHEREWFEQMEPKS